MKITVLLADDHTVVREGLKLLLNSAEDIEVVGEVENGRQAVQMAKKIHPDVVVLDLVMPVLNGVEAARQITRDVPGTRVLVLSSYSDDERVQQLIELLGRRSDERQSGLLARRCEFGVLGEEAIAGMDGVRAKRLRGG